MISPNTLLGQMSESTRVNVSASEFEVFDDTLREFGGSMRLDRHTHKNF
jgi:hypothetical protein